MLGNCTGDKKAGTTLFFPSLYKGVICCLLDLFEREINRGIYLVKKKCSMRVILEALFTCFTSI